MRLSALGAVVALAFGLAACAAGPQTGSSVTATAPASPMEVKVVVVTMFETGEDTGDKAGEFQRWKERQDLDTVYPAPHMHHDILANPDTGVIGIVTGMGTANAAASVMALGLDPRFDLSRAYWLVAGISGFDPADASLGSVAWARFLVDGDLSHEIDAREKPADWPDGYFPLFSQGPDDPARLEYSLGEAFELNPALVDWAYRLTADMDLPDHPSLAATRDLYVDYPVAQREPFVLVGDQLAAMTFWHGEMLNDWANRWVDYWTRGEGEFVSSAMEDTGTYQSLTYLDAAGKVDKDRVLVLRTASNFTLPPPGVTAADYLRQEQHDSYAGLDAALENAYLVGSKVVQVILDNWDTYREQTPQPAP
ncbi:purine nucleoside permease [Mangrovimicrobium sediminis]|uniref:Purine nucleoside permease n=1 Tax=Mangrovimicrobium sediminis TaxID=2562682 RepID=A0A4Z0M008_9GAMM|nr:purine nucleoside permease [Haliea sp. SAOS-164]TGD73003.1 purine nucleoside permease [Haliea sp. SAOS-164]